MSFFEPAVVCLFNMFSSKLRCLVGGDSGRKASSSPFLQNTFELWPDFHNTRRGDFLLEAKYLSHDLGIMSLME